MSTPLSSATSYATPTQLLQHYDARQIGDLVGDVGTRVSSASLLTDVNVQAALDRASGEIEAACLVAGKYTPDDLNILTGMALALRVGLCVDLAYWFLQIRRFPKSEITEGYRAAMEKLDRLRLGERIFGLQEVANAGLPNTTFVNQGDIDALDLTTTITKRYFGRRAKEERLGP